VKNIIVPANELRLILKQASTCLYYICKRLVDIMFLSLDEKAFSWFSDEFEIKAPLSIRLYPQYAGFGQKHKGYTLAFSAEVPTDVSFLKEMNGVIFYVEESDRWFFENTKTILSYDEGIREISIKYEEDPVVIN
jgi:uncharacterized protein YneR